MVASDGFAEFLRDQLAPLGRVTMRRMFGKTGVFCDGVMLGMVTDNTLYFRVDAHNRATFAEAAAFPPLNYRKQGSTIDLAFWRAPERLFDEPDEFVTWARMALAAARRVAAKRGRTVPSGKSKPQPCVIALLPFGLSAKNKRTLVRAVPCLTPDAGRWPAEEINHADRQWDLPEVLEKPLNPSASPLVSFSPKARCGTRTATGISSIFAAISCCALRPARSRRSSGPPSAVMARPSTWKAA